MKFLLSLPQCLEFALLPPLCCPNLTLGNCIVSTFVFGVAIRCIDSDVLVKMADRIFVPYIRGGVS